MAGRRQIDTLQESRPHPPPSLEARTEELDVPLRQVPEDTRPIDPVIPAAETDELQIGELLDSYRVRAFLGEGAMGRVYAAWDEALARLVALKVMRSQQLGSDVWRHQFFAEARAMARVRHSNVMEVYGLGTVRGTPYLVMEYVDGETLRTRLRRRESRMPVDEALGMLDALCRGTQAIHDAGVVHGDLKPGNVLVARDGRVVITDFGLALLVEASAPPWVESSLAGTPAYLAPERIEGKPIDPSMQARADVYSLGVIGFELLTGQRPFIASSTTSLVSLKSQRRPLRATQVRHDLPEAFDTVLTGAISLDPDVRPVSPQALIDALWAARDAAIDPALASTRVVLVVDDDADHRTLIAGFLHRRCPGLSVLEAEHGEDALERMRTTPVDLALVDVCMPVMDGETFVQRLRAQPGACTTPVVIVTGEPNGHQWRRLRELGAAGLVPKPFDEAMLWSAISRFLAPT
jgi:serine/threonine protein kinase